LLILAGWLPSVMGSALLRELGSGAAAVAAAGINALLASAAGGIGAAIIVKMRYSRVDLTALCAGLLGGAVAMTAGCGTITPWEAAVLGVVAGMLTPVASQWLDFKCHIDDAVGVIAPHGVGAIVAILGAGVFSQKEIAGRLAAMGVQCLGLGCVAVATVALSWMVYAALRRVSDLRVSEGDEFDGLDLAQHDVNAYPDFQQTMIKSYHMREA
jgi:Amt family ammonium transporter